MIILSYIAFTIFCLIVGYKMAMIRWTPKDLVDRLEKYDELNDGLSKTVIKLNDLQKNNMSWYMSQINTLGHYLKNEHNDTYIFDNINNGYIISGSFKPMSVS